MSQEFPELGVYTLPGRVNDPERLLEEAPLAEALGLGSVWPAERYDFKNVEVLCGAAAACTRRIKIATGLMNYPTHHPIELCSFGATMSHLSGGRFAMGFARGFDGLYHIYGTEHANLEGLAEIAELLRSLWSGGSFSGENRLGKFPLLKMNESPRESPPLVLGALGPKTLALAGRHYDGMLLHPFLTNQAIKESVALVRAGEQEAGRPPGSCKIWSTLVVAADQSEEETSAIGPARASDLRAGSLAWRLALQGQRLGRHGPRRHSSPSSFRGRQDGRSGFHALRNGGGRRDVPRPLDG